MADNNNNQSDNDEIAVVPGTDEFEKMLFKLNTPVTEDNLGVLDYNNGHLQPVQDGLYAMPAYVTDDFNLFFIVLNLLKTIGSLRFQRPQLKMITKSPIIRTLHHR